MEVALKTRVFSVLLHIFLWSMLTHFSVSYADSSELYGRTQGASDKRLFDRSFWYSFAIGYVTSATGVTIAFMYFCVPWAQLKKSMRNFTSSTRRRKNHVNANQVGKLLPLALLKKGSQEVLSLLCEPVFIN